VFIDTTITAAPATPTDAASRHDAIQAAKLADSAHQFEAMLIGQMLKPLQFGGAPGEDDSGAGASDTIRGLGTEAMSKAIAKAGGFGIADQIIRKVSAEHDGNERKRYSAKV
jgi:flagellar protein FlgJ